MTGNRSKIEWEALLSRLSPEVQLRLEATLRRSLARRLEHATRTGANVPDSVRTQAVGLWRKQHMEGASKSAIRRMNYERLKDRGSYQQLERQLLETYRKRHGLTGQTKTAVDALPFSQACETFRSLGLRLGNSGLEGVARAVCTRACDENINREEVRTELERLILDAARTEDLSGCGCVREHLDLFVSEPLRGHFHLLGVTNEDAMVARIRSSHLVKGVVALLCGGAAPQGAAQKALVAQVMQDPDARALDDLMSALVDEEDPLRRLVERLVREDAQVIAKTLESQVFAQQVGKALLNNPVHGMEYRRSVELMSRVREHVPQTPMEAYPLARTMKRRFVVHVGPTNSGKTHAALQALKEASSGAYLGPLRLLAYEQFQRLNVDGCPCTLLTGEERQEVAGAHHVSSTVEMADLHTPIELAVIDEAQMIADPDRGHFWTAAILGMPAIEIHLCCAPHAERVLRMLIGLCEDECEVIHHERMVPLQPDRGSFRLPDDVQLGDALVVFSRRAVHAVAADVAATGLKPSLVYGALPHDVRHEEARRFAEGETDVVVATDAIGMGMNLPIRRVVFVEQEKYDGRTLRDLLPGEIQQIAGRAGRYGRYDVGLFQSAHRRKAMVKKWHEVVPDITVIPVGIPENLVLVRGTTLGEAVRQWMALSQPAPFERMSTVRDLTLIDVIEQKLDPAARIETDAKHMILALASMPFDEGDRELYHLWLDMVKAEIAHKKADLPVPSGSLAGMKLADLEAEYRRCDLLYTYARTFGHQEPIPLLTARRSQISHAIMDLLAGASS